MDKRQSKFRATSQHAFKYQSVTETGTNLTSKKCLTLINKTWNRKNTRLRIIVKIYDTPYIAPFLYEQRAQNV